MKELFYFFRQVNEVLWGESIFQYWFYINLVIILLLEKRRTYRIIFAWFPIVFYIVIFNPVSYKVMSKIFPWDLQAYYCRLFSIIPILYVIGVGIVLLLAKLKNAYKLIAVLCISFLIVFKGINVYSQDWIMRAYLSTKGKDSKDDDLLNVLKTIDAKRHPFPDGGSAKNNSWSYGRIDRHWFWKLDYLLWEKHESENGLKDEAFSECSDMDHNAISSYVFRRDRSIEHLHPQNPPPEGESQDWEVDRDRRDHKDEIRDGFGNLAMISSSFNSAQSNDSISTKMGRIDDQVREKRLQSIKLLLMVRSVKSNPTGWSVNAAQTHGEKMFELLKKEVGDAN